MGTDLVQIGNHKVNFGGRKFKDIATEVCKKLNQIKFVNASYLRSFALNWENSEPRRVKKIREIKTKTDWTYRDSEDDNNFEESGSIDFDGPFNLSIYFTKDYIYFFNPPLRYSQWIEGEEQEDIAFRNEWRKYMYQMVTAFDGDRVIYLADNSHPLDGYADREYPFEEIEASLKERFGESKTQFQELAAKPYESYMVDRLQDIDWNMNFPLDCYYPEPTDLSSIAFDLNDFATKEQLAEINWDDEILKHKIIDGEVHFYHIACFRGVLVKHYGIIGETEKIETILDEYAPFTYDELESTINEDYTDDLANIFSIKFYKSDHCYAWREAIIEFEVKMVWSGNGAVGGGSFGEEESSQWFQAVNEKMAIEMLLELGVEYEVTAPIEIIRNDFLDELDEIQKICVYKRW